MTDILEIGFVRDKKIQENINFPTRKFVEQLARKKLILFSNFVIIATKFADFLIDIYDVFIFEIKHGDKTHGYI